MEFFTTIMGYKHFETEFKKKKKNGHINKAFFRGGDFQTVLQQIDKLGYMI